MIVEPGTLVWVSENGYALKSIGRVIAPIDNCASGRYYIACKDRWLIREIDEFISLTESEKVLYMLESGTQCK
jgi:hypothetical protein